MNQEIVNDVALPIGYPFDKFRILNVINKHYVGISNGSSKFISSGTDWLNPEALRNEAIDILVNEGSISVKDEVITIMNKGETYLRDYYKNYIRCNTKL